MKLCFCRKTDGTGNHNVNWSKPASQNKYHTFYLVCGINKNKKGTTRDLKGEIGNGEGDKNQQ
jgi:hypothetical protein